MKFGLILILFVVLIILCIFYCSLIIVSKQSAIREKKLLNREIY